MEPSHATDTPATLPAAALPDPEPGYEARVVRAFIKGDRLVSIPAKERKRLVVYRFLLDRVLPDPTPVDERDLNMRLALWHPDAATIRRAFVDLGLADRTGMVYRRLVPPGLDPGRYSPATIGSIIPRSPSRRR